METFNFCSIYSFTKLQNYVELVMKHLHMILFVQNVNISGKDMASPVDETHRNQHSLKWVLHINRKLKICNIIIIVDNIN